MTLTVQEFQKFPLENRIHHHEKLMKKHVGMIPVILQEKEEKNRKSLQLTNRKFIVPPTVTFGEFVATVRQKVSITPDQGLFFFTEKSTIPSMTMSMQELYDKNQNEDHFLYITVCQESTFGTY